MSTPSEESLHPIDPPASQSHETHEWTGAELHPVENHHDPIESPYAPKKAGARTVTELDLSSVEAPPPRPFRAAENLSEHLDGGGGPYARENSHQNEPDLAESCDEIVRDHERLAASVRWVQQEEAAAWLSHIAQLRPVPRFAQVDSNGSGYGAGLHNGFSSRRTRWPGTLHGPLIILILCIFITAGCIFAAPVTHRFPGGGWGLTSKSQFGAEMASLAKFIPLPSNPREEVFRTIIVREDDPVFAGRERAADGFKSLPIAGETVATPQADIPDAQGAPSGLAHRKLDPKEITLLKKQGEQFIDAGDVVAARLSFQRAAEAGDADAAVALGATYDPDVLAKLGAVGMDGDLAKARSWYQRAERLGLPEARRRKDFVADR
jgi:hypothetical protein